jgi:hypothetical protein
VAVTALSSDGANQWQRPARSELERPPGFTGASFGYSSLPLPIFDNAKPGIGNEHTRQCGELRLILAMLKDALEAALADPRGPRRMSTEREAKAWIFSNDRSSPFTFLGACDLLDIDPGYVRSRVRRRMRLPA